MKRKIVCVAAVIVTLSLFCTLSLSHAADSNEIGVVLLHGMNKATQWINPLVKQFKKEKIQVVTPEMTWSENRKWDVSFSDTMTEIDTAVEALRKSGKTKIFVAGHSIGASASVAYASTHEDIAGVLLIAPGHTTEMENFQEELAANVNLAKQMVSVGKSDEVVKFKGKLCTDVAKSNPKANKLDWSVKTSSTIYLSHFDPDFKDLLSENIQKLNSEMAVLWIAGKSDSWTKTDGEKVFAMAPQNPQNKYIIVKGGHLQTPDIGKKEITHWVLETGSI